MKQRRGNRMWANLPRVVSLAEGSSITTVYDAAGRLLMRDKNVYIPGTFPVRNRDKEWRFGPFVYRSRYTLFASTPSLDRVELPNGYVKGDTAYYYVKDYLGSVRQVLNGTTGAVVQENHYYPYGGLFGESAQPANAEANAIKFGGKELLAFRGLQLSDFGPRLYDPAFGLFRAQDPVDDQHRRFSSYLYCAANPVNLADPTGREGLRIVDNENQTIYIMAHYYTYYEGNENIVSNLESIVNNYLNVCFPFEVTTGEYKGYSINL